MKRATGIVYRWPLCLSLSAGNTIDLWQVLLLKRCSKLLSMKSLFLISALLSTGLSQAQTTTYNHNGVPGPTGCVIGQNCTSSLTPIAVNGVQYATLFPGLDIGAKVNAAILAVGCGEVVIPAGTYPQSTMITKPRCVKLHGASGYSTALNWTPTSGVAILIADTSGQFNYPEGDLSDITLSGTGAGNTAIAVYLGGDPAGGLISASAFGDHQNFQSSKSLKLRYSDPMGQSLLVRYHLAEPYQL
jgi:hypothetical protein